MVRAELRIVLALIATFVMLAGIAVAIHGLLFDQDMAMLYGTLAIGVGVAGCVVLLSLWPKDSS
jgi:hypothetical protein